MRCIAARLCANRRRRVLGGIHPTRTPLHYYVFECDRLCLRSLLLNIHNPSSLYFLVTTYEMGRTQTLDSVEALDSKIERRKSSIFKEREGQVPLRVCRVFGSRFSKGGEGEKEATRCFVRGQEVGERGVKELKHVIHTSFLHFSTFLSSISLQSLNFI